jgi:Family of unknown function (DUF6114)
MLLSEHSQSESAAVPTRASAGKWPTFVAWSRNRPFVGAVLTMAAGVEMFFSSQLDLGNIHVQLGIEGLQSTILPVLMVILGLLTMLMPVHRIFYGIIALVVSVYSLIGLNLGGFFVGMLLGAVGGIMIVSWMPKSVGRAGQVDQASQVGQASQVDQDDGTTDADS